MFILTLIEKSSYYTEKKLFYKSQCNTYLVMFCKSSIKPLYHPEYKTEFGYNELSLIVDGKNLYNCNNTWNQKYILKKVIKLMTNPR